MFKLNSKLTMACSAAVLALAMTACSSSSDDDPPVASNVPEVVEPSGPTNDQVAASQTALNAHSVCPDGTRDGQGCVRRRHECGQCNCRADGSHCPAGGSDSCSNSNCSRCASDAQKEAFGDTAEADAAAAVMSAADAVTLANAVVEAVALANAIAASQTALNAYSSAQTAHTAAKAAYDADMSVDNATALQTAATALEAAATAAQTAIAAGASDAQKEAFGDTAVADATAAVMSAADAVTLANASAADAVALANAIMASQTALDEYSLTQTAYTTAKAAYDADTSVANATDLQMAATALQAAAMAAHTAIAAGSTDVQKEAFGDTAVAEAAQAVADAAAFVIAARIVADEGAEALKDVQSGVMAAMTAAGVASEEAQTAATAAQDARANRATMQTDDLHADNSGELADKAQEHADAAAAAAKAADDANVMAMAATDVEAATRELVMAQAAQDTAEKQQGYAETARDNAATAAMAELTIEGTVKTVGDTSIDAAADRSVVTTGEDETAQVVDTGLQLKGEFPMATGEGADDGVLGAQDDPDMDDNQAIKHVQKVTDRTFPIGKVVDSENDTARLMIVIKYAGSKNAYVYNLGADLETGTKAGYIGLDDGDATNNNADGNDVNNVALRSEGTFYAAGPDGGGEGALDHDDEVLDTTKAVEVFSYVDPLGTPATDNDMKKYVVLTGENENKVDGVTTYTYINVDVEVTVAAAGNNAEAFDTKVRAVIPEATDYEHIHFGAWAALGEAANDGRQKIADLGIGFVQSIGDGLTGADMPNNGTGNYSGNWVATVRVADEDGNGAIVLESGAASLDADFGMDEITATLTDLATLSGDISGNTFNGDTAEDITHDSLDADGKFTGSFSGGFYGAKAAEAGGIFDFTSDDKEAGEFRGAFGADRKK